MISPIRKPPSAPGVTHTNALSGAKNRELASVLTTMPTPTSASISDSRGAPRRVRHSSVRAAPVMPHAVMMVSDSQYCSTLIGMSPRSMVTRSMSVSSQSDSHSDSSGRIWPLPNR